MQKLTIAELEQMLQDARHYGATDDTPVHISYNYGDHWRTQVAPYASKAEMLYVEHSEYHRMDVLKDDEGYEVTDNQVLVIS